MTSDDLEKYGTIGAGGIPVGKYRVEIMALAGGFRSEDSSQDDYSIANQSAVPDIYDTSESPLRVEVKENMAILLDFNLQPD